MKKFIIAITAVVLLAACTRRFENDEYYVVAAGADDTSYLQGVSGCPIVHIRNNDIEIIQTAEYRDLFEIKAVGYEGYCYYNEAVKKYRAVVSPKFKVKRLSNSDITDVQFSYYLETVEGPEKYLGRKTYFAKVSIPENADEIFYTADRGELGIPEPGSYDLDIYLGLNANRFDAEYKK